EEEPFPLTERDKVALSQTDEEFQLHTWDELKTVIATNTINVLTRKPSQVRAYIDWCRQIKREYGSISNYLTEHRLPWGPPPCAYLSSVPLSGLDDYLILMNDWPYGFTSDITHIVVWSKTPIATDDENGGMTDESRRVLGDFVKRTFVDRLGGDQERVLWFKNWVHLQSVRALEHFHVLVRNASKEDLEFWTGKQQGRNAGPASR
ncbi:hypothetical protein BJ875DRAFT_370998, partial [Amylocarpus encephaloides]